MPDDGVARVLSGERAYDTLDAADQAAVRDAWEQRLSAGCASLNLEEDFAAAGLTSWPEGNGNGHVTVHHAAASPEPAVLLRRGLRRSER